MQWLIRINNLEMAGLQELDRFDFTPGPTSADCIENGVWLGEWTFRIDYNL